MRRLFSALFVALAAMTFSSVTPVTAASPASVTVDKSVLGAVNVEKATYYRRGYRNRGYRYYGYRNRGYRNYGYNRGYRNYGYNRGYRNYGYRNNGYGRNY